MTDNNVNQIESSLAHRYLSIIVVAIVVIVCVAWGIVSWLNADKQKAISACREQASQSAKSYTGACVRCLEDKNVMDAEQYCQSVQ